jgi:hypothetical protein
VSIESVDVSVRGLENVEPLAATGERATNENRIIAAVAGPPQLPRINLIGHELDLENLASLSTCLPSQKDLGCLASKVGGA